MMVNSSSDSPTISSRSSPQQQKVEEAVNNNSFSEQEDQTKEQQQQQQREQLQQAHLLHEPDHSLTAIVPEIPVPGTDSTLLTAVQQLQSLVPPDIQRTTPVTAEVLPVLAVPNQAALPEPQGQGPFETHTTTDHANTDTLIQVSTGVSSNLSESSTHQTTLLATNTATATISIRTTSAQRDLHIQEQENLSSLQSSTSDLKQHSLFFLKSVHKDLFPSPTRDPEASQPLSLSLSETAKAIPTSTTSSTGKPSALPSTRTEEEGEEESNKMAITATTQTVRQKRPADSESRADVIMSTGPALSCAASASMGPGTFDAKPLKKQKQRHQQPADDDSGNNIHNHHSSNNQSSSSAASSSRFATGRWTDAEHQAFLQGLATYGREWKRVAVHIPTRSSAQVRSHAQKYFAKRQAEQAEQAAAEAAAAEAVAASVPSRHLSSQSNGTGDAAIPGGTSSALSTLQNPQVTESFRANVARILQEPETVQAEVNETLRQLRQRYRELQQRLNQRLQRESDSHRVAGEESIAEMQQNLQEQQQNLQQNHDSGGGGRPPINQAAVALAEAQDEHAGGNSSWTSHSIDSLHDSELIALRVLQGGLPNHRHNHHHHQHQEGLHQQEQEHLRTTDEQQDQATAGEESSSGGSHSTTSNHSAAVAVAASSGGEVAQESCNNNHAGCNGDPAKQDGP